MLSIYQRNIIEKNEVTAPLINEIEEYVESILGKGIPQIPYSAYMDFYENGTRKEFEDSYFNRRKQLTALGVYLQWNNSKEAINHFNELLWSISNEFSWCLAAHLSYDKNGFKKGAANNIDLFSAETAQTLSEIIVIHKREIGEMLYNHIKNQIETRVIEPFLLENWEWETVTYNWSAVCAGCIGIAALILENGEKKQLIINKVEKALEYYLSGFENDGVALEGIGYWTYGFGYYIYYKSLKEEKIESEFIEKIRAIADFPQRVQISENIFVPFSDVPPSMCLPSGLISYLNERYDIKLPLMNKITSFDFDHCYRWAHISRNLWWTRKDIFNKRIQDNTSFFEESQWLTIRNNDLFFAIKGGNNNEPHNHNDLGSFIVAVDGELVIVDLGAGPYTAGYFGKDRYTYDHTRSYYHSVPLINNTEQNETHNNCEVESFINEDKETALSINLKEAYSLSNIDSYIRKINFRYLDNVLVVEDVISSLDNLNVNEGFISYIEPRVIYDGIISWKIKNKTLNLKYDSEKFTIKIEKKDIKNHYNESNTIYRTALISSDNNNLFNESFKIYLG